MVFLVIPLNPVRIFVHRDCFDAKFEFEYQYTYFRSIGTVVLISA